MTKLTGYFCALVACVLVAGSASANILDQSNEGPQWGGGVIGELGWANLKIDRGQTFTVGQTGQLTGIEVDIFKTGFPVQPLTLDVRPLDGSAPELTSTNSLGSISLLPNEVSTGWVMFDLTAANINVTAGQQLAFVLESAQDFDANANQYSFSFSGDGNDQDFYLGGSLWEQDNGGPWAHTFDNDSYDMRFHTFVTPEPATLTLLILGGFAMIRRRRCSN